MYQQDLDLDRYHGLPKDNELAVGWLSKEYLYNEGYTDPKILLYLKWLLPQNFYRGFHICEFCEKEKRNGCYKIFDEQSQNTYVLPVLVIHYIEQHRYRMPNIVEQAILRNISLGSKDPNLTYSTGR